MVTQDALPMWTVYEKPRDYPNSFVARLFYVTKEIQATDHCLVAPDLESIRNMIPPGLVCLASDPSDDPSIVETWF